MFKLWDACETSDGCRAGRSDQTVRTPISSESQQNASVCLRPSLSVWIEHLRSGSGVHKHVSGLATKGLAEEATGVLVDKVTEVWLSTKLVDTLGDLVTGSVTKTREERDKLASHRSVGCVLEDDLAQVANGDGTAVRHQSFSDSVYWVEHDELGDTCWSATLSAQAIQARTMQCQLRQMHVVKCDCSHLPTGTLTPHPPIPPLLLLTRGSRAQNTSSSALTLESLDWRHV